MNSLHLIDLDGTVNTMDMLAALEGRGNPEVRLYLELATDFVAKGTGIPLGEVQQGLLRVIRQVHSRRDAYEHWGSFPSADGQMVKIVPAVDHFMLVRAGVELFFRDYQDRPGVKTFLIGDWAYRLFRHCSDGSKGEAAMDSDAQKAIDLLLRRDQLVALFTNSDTDKAVQMLTKAGFGSRVQLDGVFRGHVGAIGNGRRFEVDFAEPTEGAFADLSPHFGFPVQLDLRRRRMINLVRELLVRTGATQLCVYTDMPEMEGYPLERAFPGQVRHGMKVNPDSVESSIWAARILLQAVTSKELSVLAEWFSRD